MKGRVCRYSLTRWHQLLQWGQNRDTEMAQLFQIQKYGLKHVTPQEGSGPELRRTTRFHIKIQKRRRHAPRAVAPSTLLPSSEQEPEALAAHSPLPVEYFLICVKACMCGVRTCSDTSSLRCVSLASAKCLTIHKISAQSVGRVVFEIRKRVVHVRKYSDT